MSTLSSFVRETREFLKEKSSHASVLQPQCASSSSKGVELTDHLVRVSRDNSTFFYFTHEIYTPAGGEVRANHGDVQYSLLEWLRKKRCVHIERW